MANASRARRRARIMWGRQVFGNLKAALQLSLKMCEVAGGGYNC